MNKDNLEHIIRAACAITNEYEVIIVGSQSILGSIDYPPEECCKSKEADIIIPGNERLSDIIDGAMGEGSPFEDAFGYYAQGVDSSTCTLPLGWRDRLIRIQSNNTNGSIGYCLDLIDLFLSKCFANREKDVDFNKTLLYNGLLSTPELYKRLELMPVDDQSKSRMKIFIDRHTLSMPSNKINRIRKLAKITERKTINSIFKNS